MTKNNTKQKSIKKMHIILLIAVAAGLLISKTLQYYWTDASISLKNQELHVLVAKNRYQMIRGLGKRDTLGKYDGMLFIFSGEGRRPGIVMRDMRFPIDIVWLSGENVVDIAKSVMPEPGKAEQDLTVYYPRATANLVVELPAGWADTYGLMIGDKMSLIEE